MQNFSSSYYIPYLGDINVPKQKYAKSLVFCSKLTCLLKKLLSAAVCVIRKLISVFINRNSIYILYITNRNNICFYT